MAYIIRANNIEYTVRLHALENMRKRYISEDMVIKTIEAGMLLDQAHSKDLYELQYFDEDFQKMVIIQVVISPDEKAILTVIDDTSAKEE